MTCLLLRYTRSYVLHSSYSPHLSAGSIEQTDCSKKTYHLFMNLLHWRRQSKLVQIYLEMKKKKRSCAFFFMEGKIVDIVRLFSS